MRFREEFSQEQKSSPINALAVTVQNQSGNHVSQADFPGLIRAMPNWITSESPTTRPEWFCIIDFSPTDIAGRIELHYVVCG
jgi:hypothetical protein